MAFKHSAGSQVVVGQSDLSEYLRTFESELSAVSHEVTTLPKTSVVRFAGLHDGSLSIAGLFDAAADAIVAPLVGGSGSAVIATIGVPAVGSRVRCGTAQETNYRQQTPVGDMIGFTAELVGSNSIYAGSLLAAFAALTGTGALASVDRQDAPGATSSALGALAVLIVTAVDTLTTATMKIQHSADDAVWADLVTFTNITALGVPGTQVVEVAVGTTINRYVRANLTALTGTSVTVGVAFARKTR